jgi:hypothetical protein
MMTRVVVVMVMMRLRKGRGREQQHKRENNQLLHGAIVTRNARRLPVENAAGIFFVTAASSVESEIRPVSSKGVHDYFQLQPQTVLF